MNTPPPSAKLKELTPSETAAAEAFIQFIRVVAQLRNPQGGCPWDLEQRHETLKQYLIEEAYEVLDAIDNDRSKLPDELGDVLLQVVLHSQIGTDEGTFDIERVIRLVSDKMIRRHPHVFGEHKARDSKEVLQNWEMRKQNELPEGKSILDSVPRGMPALLRAQRIGDKSARVGFEWSTVEDVRDKVLEELREFLEQALAPEISRARLEDELGDVLFSLSQLSRRLGCNAEDLLHQAADKFSRRFRKVEQRATPRMQDYTLEQLDQFWNEVKKDESR